MLDERSFLASFAMAGIIGMVCSLLLFRKSMVQGWMFVVREGRLPPREDEGAFRFVGRKEEGEKVDAVGESAVDGGEKGLRSPTVRMAKERRGSGGEEGS